MSLKIESRPYLLQERPVHPLDFPTDLTSGKDDGPTLLQKFDGGHVTAIMGTNPINDLGILTFRRELLWYHALLAERELEKRGDIVTASEFHKRATAFRNSLLGVRPSLNPATIREVIPQGRSVVVEFGMSSPRPSRIPEFSSLKVTGGLR